MRWNIELRAHVEYFETNQMTLLGEISEKLNEPTYHTSFSGQGNQLTNSDTP